MNCVKMKCAFSNPTKELKIPSDEFTRTVLMHTHFSTLFILQISILQIYRKLETRDIDVNEDDGKCKHWRLYRINNFQTSFMKYCKLLNICKNDDLSRYY